MAGVPRVNRLWLSGILLRVMKTRLEEIGRLVRTRTDCNMSTATNTRSACDVDPSHYKAITQLDRKSKSNVAAVQ